MAGEEQHSNALLAFLVVGVLGSFVLFGWAQEQVTQSTFGPNQERFREVSFLVVVQSVGNSLIAAVVLLFQGGSKTNFTAGVPTKDWLIVSLGYLGAHQFGLAALKWIIFPLQVICKSCKAIPVMIGEMVFAKKQHPLSKKIKIVLMCIGVVMFTMLGKQKESKMGTASETSWGLFLVLLALICDGIYGPYQNKITQEYKPSAYHLMFNMNVWEALFALILCVATGDFVKAITFIQKYPDILPILGVFTAMMGFGNIFIYQLQRNFGALTVTTTTTMRKLISVLFSVLWFGHSIFASQWAAVLVVFFAPTISQYIAAPFEQKKKISQKVE